MRAAPLSTRPSLARTCWTTYLHLKKRSDDGYDRYAIRTPEWKYLHSEDGTTHQLFDLVRDPEERRDVSATEPAQVARMRELLALALSQRELDVSSFLEPPDDEHRKEVEDRLRSLGYIN